VHAGDRVGHLLRKTRAFGDNLPLPRRGLHAAGKFRRCPPRFQQGNSARSAYAGRADVYFKKDDADDRERALVDYNQAIRLDPKSVDGFVHRGDFYYSEHDRDHALADYAEAIRLDPKNFAAYEGRANVYLEKDDFDHALAEYAEAIRLDPKNSAAYKARAEIYAKKDDFDRAVADYGEAIRLNSEDATAYYERADLQLDEGDPARAVADYSEVVRLSAGPVVSVLNIQAHLGRGAAYIATGDFDRAIAEYSELASSSSGLDERWLRIGYHTQRGLAYLFSGNLQKALDDVSKDVESRPSEAETVLWADIIRQRSNLPSQLPQALSKIDMTKWPAPVVRLFLGQTTPVDVLAAANSKIDELCEANVYTGEWWLRQGAKDEAILQFRRTASAKECRRNHRDFWKEANAELKVLGAAP
jgi:tetratricopeptide (TPR) repeat protein